MIHIEFINSDKLDDFMKYFIGGTDYDIDKVQYRIPNELDNSPEITAYNRIKTIANMDTNDVCFATAIKILTKDVKLISKLIKDNNIKHPEELEEFTENAIAIMHCWDEQYREAFNTIKEFRDSYKAPKSIDEMNADELREYIKTHNIKQL